MKINVAELLSKSKDLRAESVNIIEQSVRKYLKTHNNTLYLEKWVVNEHAYITVNPNGQLAIYNIKKQFIGYASESFLIHCYNVSLKVCLMVNEFSK